MHNCIDGLKFYGSLDLPPPPFMVNADVWSPFWNNGPCTVETMTWQLLLAIAIQFHQRKITLRSPFLHFNDGTRNKTSHQMSIKAVFIQCNVSGKHLKNNRQTSPMHRL